MSNIDRATLVINETYADEYVKPHMAPPKVAQALADNGLLMPDLPSVEFNGDGIWGNIWEDCGVTVYRGRRTLELYAAIDYGDLPETLEPDEARETAYALLAASNYVERNQE